MFLYPNLLAPIHLHNEYPSVNVLQERKIYPYVNLLYKNINLILIISPWQNRYFSIMAIKYF